MAENNKNIETLVEELIKLTKEMKIQWRYTDNDMEVYKIQKKVFENFDMFALASDNCFYTKIQNGYMLLIEEVGMAQPHKNYLIIVPSIDAKDIAIYDSPQSQIIRLHSLILKQFPTVEDYITDVFNTFKKMST